MTSGTEFVHVHVCVCGVGCSFSYREQETPQSASLAAEVKVDTRVVTADRDHGWRCLSFVILLTPSSVDCVHGNVYSFISEKPGFRHYFLNISDDVLENMLGIASVSLPSYIQHNSKSFDTLSVKKIKALKILSGAERWLWEKALALESMMV